MTLESAAVHAPLGSLHTDRVEQTQLRGSPVKLLQSGGGASIRLPPEIVAGIIKTIDVFLIATATGIGLNLFNGELAGERSLLAEREVLMSALAALVFLLIFQGIGGYKLKRLANLHWQVTRSASVLAFTGSALLATALMTKQSAVDPVAWATACTAVAVLIERSLLWAALSKCAPRGRFAHNVVIVGAGEETERLVAKLLQSKDMNVTIRGVFDDRQTRLPNAVRQNVLGTSDALLPFARLARIDEVIIALPLSAGARISELIEKLSPLAVDLRVSADPVAEEFCMRGISYIGEVPLLSIADRPIKNWSTVIKWIEDKALGTLLLVFLAPLLALIALLIKLESRGPICFIQERYGFNNESIKVFKFRTMYTARCDRSGAQRTVKNDPRVTRFGRVLRSLSLDELPQLFNVLKGDMSLVGPRPHPLPMMAGDRRYDQAVAKYAHRHRVKPGITGWAQVNGNRGEIYTIEKARSRVELDLDYIEKWSLLLDLKILALTGLRLLQRDAY